MEPRRLETNHSTKVTCWLDWTKVFTYGQEDRIPHSGNDQTRRSMEDQSKVEVLGYCKEESHKETETNLLEV